MPTITENPYADLFERVEAAGQSHILKFWHELDEKQQHKLAAQIEKIDFQQMEELNRDFIQTGARAAHGAQLMPADFIHLPKTEDQRHSFEQARRIGEEALRAGHVAAFLVAGGQGSRLGFNGPKGKFPISPVRDKTLFQLHSEKILALSRRYGAVIPWLILTSETNHDETQAYFEEHDFWGLRPDDIRLFKQAMIPALAADGRLLLNAKDHIFCNPNGHGGSLSALQESGALAEMAARGIKYIFYFQVDNVLINICDPVFLGFHIQEEAEMSAKVVIKRDPEEKVGVVGWIDGKLGVIEYSDLSQAEKEARTENGRLKFEAGSIAIHIFNLDFIRRETEGGLRLPWHLANKKIAHIDDSGEFVTPEEPNAFKFETFVFDALTDARKATILEVAREEEFSPVKNAEGEDSPETARRDQVAQFKRWLAQANVDLTNADSAAIEISPLIALDADELRQKLEAGEVAFKEGVIE